MVFLVTLGSKVLKMTYNNNLVDFRESSDFDRNKEPFMEDMIRKSNSFPLCCQSKELILAVKEKQPDKQRTALGLQDLSIARFITELSHSLHVHVTAHNAHT